MKFFQLVFFIGLISELKAQGPILTPLKSNKAIQYTSSISGVKRAVTDTIQLPFFDDFTSSTVYPNMKYWRDSQVYINDHFAISPPSYGVATFDNLNKKGKPYQAISGLTKNHSDSLTSNFINLKNYKSGLNTVNYTIADSIYLSFFYQTQGLGDPLDGSDSLVLKFKNAGGFWKTVWKTTGKSVKPFKQVMIGVMNTEYLNPDFQFRFMNYGKTTGNMNQWHLDYIRMNFGRNRNDTGIADVAINAVPVGPLQWYESMPYDHFKAKAAFNTSSVHTLKLRNNNSTAVVNVQYKAEVRNRYNQLILNYPLTSSARNILFNSDSSEDFNSFNFDTLSGKYPFLKIKYTIQPLAFDTLTDNYNSVGNNNVYTKTTRFKNYFAYDDGSAEGGFGLDYGSLPAGPGYAAVKFLTSKPDTLRGISIFFNRSVSDVAFKSFNLIVWKQISEPPATNTSNDIILKKINIPSAIYTDSINGFTDFIFDTAVALDEGVFYIGWQQNINFMLNVGYDHNYQYAKTGGRNPNLFYNLNGYWEKVNATITGAVMMRPLVGEKIVVKNPANINALLRQDLVKIYPNPSGSQPRLMLVSNNRIVSIKIYNSIGIFVKEYSGDNLLSIPVDELNEGLYLLEITDHLNQKSQHKWIKQSI